MIQTNSNVHNIVYAKIDYANSKMCLSVMKPTSAAKSLHQKYTSSDYSTPSSASAAPPSPAAHEEPDDFEPEDSKPDDFDAALGDLEPIPMEGEPFEDENRTLKRSSDNLSSRDIFEFINDFFPPFKKLKSSDHDHSSSSLAFEYTGESLSNAGLAPSQAQHTEKDTSLPSSILPHPSLPNQPISFLNASLISSSFQPLVLTCTDTDAQSISSQKKDFGLGNATRQTMTSPYEQNVRYQQQTPQDMGLEHQPISSHSNYPATSPTFLSSNQTISFNAIKAARRKKRTRRTTPATFKKAEDVDNTAEKTSHR